MQGHASWIMTYNIIFIENNLASNDQKVTEINNLNGVITLVVSFPMALCIGVIFDTVGRKKPFIFAWILATIAFAGFPIFKSVPFFYLFNAML